MVRTNAQKKIQVADVIDVTINPATEETLQQLVGIGIPVYDYIDLTYTGSDLTGVIYKIGGSGGTVVATLVLAYSSGVLVSVTKT